MNEEQKTALKNLITASDNLLGALVILDSRIGLGCCDEQNGWCNKCIEASMIVFSAKIGWEKAKKDLTKVKIDGIVIL